jgi:hypothetical protein
MMGPMNESAITEKVAGRYGTVRFPITASLILAVLVLGATILYWVLNCDHREVEKFGIEGLTLAAGLLSAYYIGKGLRDTVAQRDQEMQQRKIASSLRIIERWNQPDFAKMKQQFRDLIESGKAHDANYVENELTTKSETRTVVVEVLNFFEEAALVANIDYADDATLKAYFLGALTDYFTTLEPWIKQHRASKSRPNMWCEMENMLSRWR